MSTEYANLGFRVDSSGLMTADQRLKNVTQSGRRAESQINMLSKTVGVAAAAFSTFNASMSIKNTIFGFDTALKGLQATTRATAADMAKLEAQARQLGATSKFSATEAAEAQRFLAMAGFDTNKILASTPSVLKLATAGEISLAQAADMASNALGGMQLPVEELDRVIDVMAEAASSANTNISELSEALSYAAPLAATAGVEVEELAAVIGALSDSGIKSSRAGTGVIGIIRQLSNITPQAAEAISKYGITLDDVNIKANGLTAVMKTLRDANLDSQDAFKIFGSEAAAAGLIVSSYSEKVQTMTERYRNAKGSANEMANIMAGSLSAGALGLSSALQEVALQIGDAGVAGGMKEAMTAATGFVHVFTGMLPEFAAANNLTADYVSNLNDVADIATIAAGSLGGLLGLMLTTKVATMGAAGAMGILNAVILANPFVLAVSAIAAVTGALYAARNMTVKFGGETVKVRDIVVGAFNAISDGFDIVSDAAVATYNLLGGFFAGLSQNSQSTGADITSTIGGSFLNIYNGAKSLVNGVIATFVTLGKSIGIIAASVTMAFSNSFDNVKNLGSALKQDLDAVLSGDFSANNLKSAIDKAFTNPLKMTFSELGKVAADSFNTNYIGESAKELSGIFSEIKSGLELYVIAARNARTENEKLSDSNKDLADDIEWALGELDKLNSGGGKSKGSGGGIAAGMSDELESLIDQVDNFGGAWTRTGNVIVDAMGSAADAMVDYMSQVKELESQEKSLLKQQEESQGNKEKLAEIDKALEKVAINRSIAEINGYQAASRAAQDMFSEKTAAYKAFSAINQVLSLAEIALSYQKITAGAAATTAHVSQEGTKQSANALTAITSAFAAPFPVNFVAGAAMIGIMASLLGGAFGGGGGSYEMPEAGGTGTVLGDSSAQSSSIVGASERLEDIQTDQLSELMAIRQSMSKLSSGIQNLAKSFATGLDFGDSGYAGQLGTISSSSLPSLFKELPSFVDPLLSFVDGIVGGIIGGFSSKKKKLIDSGITFVTQTMQDVFESGELDASMFQVIETTKKKFWGLSKSTSTKTETSSIGGAITAQMADIFGYIGDTVVAAAESLGMDAKHIITTGLETLSLDEALSNFVIDIGDVSFADKTGEEIQKELEAIFSQQADLMAQYLVPSITEYQQVGEGAFETLQRVAYEQAVFNDALDRTGVSLKELSSIMQIDIAQSIISLVGGVDEFTELANSFFENFYTEAEQFNYLQSSISDVFAELGVGMVASREEFRNLVEGIDLTTESGQQLYAALMQISPAMAEYFNTLDDVARDKLNLQIELLEKQGNSEKALALQRQLELESMDESLRALMQQIWALDDAARAERERAQAIAEAQALMDQKTGLRIRLLEAQGKTQEAVAMQRKLELSQLDESLRALQKQIWAQQDLNEARAEERQLLTDNVAFAEQQLEKARRAEIDRINSTVDAAQEAYNSQLEIINEQRRAYDDLISGLELKISNAETALGASLDSEKAKYQAVISSAEESYRLQLDSINAQRDAYNSLINELENKVSNAEKALRNSLDAEISKYNLVISSAEEAYNLQLEAINAQRDAYNALISDLENKVSSAESALSASLDAEIARYESIISSAREAYDLQIDSINAQRDAYKSLISELEQKVSGAESSLSASLSSEMSMYDDMISAAKSGAQKQIDAINEVSSARISALNSELSIASSVASKYGAASAAFTASEALAAARTGNFSKAQNISSNENFTSAEQARISAAREAFALNEIGKLADAQVSDLERTISATESSAQSQVMAINKASSEQILKLEEQKAEIEKQVNAILGIDNSILSIDDAIKQYQDAQSELESEIAKETLSKLDQQESIALDTFNRAKMDAENQIDLLQEQVDAILGVDNSVLSLTDAIIQYQEAQKELANASTNGTIESLGEQEKAALESYEQAKADAEKQIQLLQSQVDTILGVDNSVIELSEAIKQYQDAQSELDSTLAQSTLEKLQSQEDLALSQLEQAKADANKQIELLQKQVDTVLGVDNSVLDLAEAIKQYQDAQSELDYALSQNALEKLQAQEDIAKQALEQAKEDAQQQIDALNAQVDLLLNIDNSVSSVEEAIKLLLAEREALAEFENSLQEEQLEIQKLIVDSIHSIGNKIEKGNELIGGGKTGTIINDPTVPIITPPIVIYPQAIKDHDVVEQIKMLRKEMDNANAQIGANTADTASTVRKLEYLQSNQQ